ncbi:MAG: response regulator, partial [Candidatus Eisenbacteria bacterium]
MAPRSPPSCRWASRDTTTSCSTPRSVTNRRLEEVNAQLEEASRLKSEFLANTSHELRTPLNGMMGFLQLVLDGMCRSKDEEREFLKQALQCSRHLLNLINDVLDIARIEAGKLSLDLQKIEIATLFQEVRTVTHVQASQRDVKLVFVEPEAEDAAVRCDLNKAKQVLINLVGNSLKFTPKGSITVRAIPRPDLGHVRFEVIDTGIGIPPVQQSVIFEKFAQGDGSTTRKYGGAGLGLAISKSLVELMGGVIGVQSEGRGHGTTMYFSLPVWTDQVAADEETDDADAAQDQIDGPAGGALVLVVEDDPVFRKFVTVVLHQHGYRTVEVASAEAGWMRVRRLRPAIVVLDYAL